MQGVPLELFPLMQGVLVALFTLVQGAPTPLWCSISYYNVLQGYLEETIWGFEALREGGWGGGSSLDSRWSGIRFPNLMRGYLRPLLLILNLLYSFILINWTLSPLWREEGLWYSYTGGISRWYLSKFGRQMSSFGRLLSSFRDLAWIVGWKIATLRLGCDVLSLCNSMHLLD